jgi:dTDP-4-amino-4,6-dideoxygalactose transaminase
MAYRVRFVKPQDHYRRYKAELDAAILGCLERGDLIARKELQDFESSLAAYVGTKYAVGVNSGYHALALSLVAAGVGPGQEVIVPAHTFVASVSSIVHCGATPVLVDVAPDYNIDLDRMEAALTPRTRAVMPVHLNGRICDMERVMGFAERHGLVVIEDSCQSLGAAFKGRRAGSWGKAGCWSFYPFKILGCFGDGGAVTTNDPDLARAVTLLRFNGEDRATGEYHYHGFTALLDNIQAAALDVKLRHFPGWIEHRRSIAELYRKELEGTGDLRLPSFPGQAFFDVYQNYVVRTTRRDALRAHLKESGIETLVSWPKPIWEHAALKLGNLDLPETRSICREVLSLPMSAETESAEVSLVGQAVRNFFMR